MCHQNKSTNPFKTRSFACNVVYFSQIIVGCLWGRLPPVPQPPTPHTHQTPSTPDSMAEFCVQLMFTILQAEPPNLIEFHKFDRQWKIVIYNWQRHFHSLGVKPTDLFIPSDISSLSVNLPLQDENVWTSSSNKTQVRFYKTNSLPTESSKSWKVFTPVLQVLFKRLFLRLHK